MLEIEIENHARNFERPGKLERSLDSRDMGLGIMQAMVDEVEVLEEGRLIRLEKKIRASNRRRRRVDKSAATPAQTE
jgi:hypothetical protein